MKKLLAGPFCSEMGWELCAWVPYLRYIAQEYDEVVIVCQPGHDYLYKDLGHEFEHWQYKAKYAGDNWVFDRFPTVEPFMPKAFRRKYPHHVIKVPSKSRCMSKKKRFVRYGDLNIKEIHRYDIVLHARAETKYHSKTRNMGWQMWQKIARKLPGRICCVGTRNGAHLIDGVEDMRGIKLDLLATIMRHAKVVVGESSGPLHLASLCKTSHVVITGNEPQKALGGKTNRWRYEVLWNPFSTPCKVLDKNNWRASTDAVVRAVKGFL